MIDFFNISKQDKKFSKNIIHNISKIIKSNNFINGGAVKLFEKKFAKFCSTKHCISVANGTDALFIALKALNLKKNDEVIVPAMTWKSTVLAPLNLNFKPILVDIEKNGSDFDLNELKKKITKRTKVIIVVHLYGNPANIKGIKNLIKNRNISIIEDAAQAHGAFDFILKKKVGSIGDIACFSFYPGKNLGAYGDAGCLTTNKNILSKKIRLIKNIGSMNKYDCEIKSINSRMDTIQAAVLNIKLDQLNNNNKKRNIIANIYFNNIRNKNIDFLNYRKGAVYHQFVIISKLRKKIIKQFKKNKISYGMHYPISINKLKIFKNRFKNKKFPNAEIIAKYGLSLPMDPNLKHFQIIKICKILNEV